MDERLLKLREYLDEQGITQESIAQRFEISKQSVNQLLTGKKPFGKQNAQRWSKEFGLSAAWLLTGEGNMLNDTNKTDDEVIWLPVINFDSRGGKGINEEVDTLEYTTAMMPFSRTVARQGDFIMPVIGESMSPKYPSGSYVLVRPLPTWREYLELGATYILDLLDGRRVIKDVRAGNDKEHFLLCSVNPAFDSSEVAKSFIQHIFAVILAVRRDLLMY